MKRQWVLHDFRKWTKKRGCVCLTRNGFRFHSLTLEVACPHVCLPLQDYVLHLFPLYWSGPHTFAPTHKDSLFRGTLISCCALVSSLSDWSGVQTPPLVCVFPWDWGSQIRREERKKKLHVSHSKVGVIEGQGGVQKNGSRAGKLQVRQEGQLNTTCPFFQNAPSSVPHMKTKEMKINTWQLRDTNKDVSWKAAIVGYIFRFQSRLRV